MTQPPEGQPATGVPTCYRHPGREAHIRCQRCDRTICPDCMSSAAVGFHCPECVKEGNKGSRQNQALYGGERSADPRLTSFVLIGINLVVWLAIYATGGGASRLTRLLALIPQGACGSRSTPGGIYPGVTSSQVCQTVNAGDGVWHAGFADGAWWQPVTSMFTQVDVWHIALNMMALFILGPALERIVGRVRFLMVYLVGGLGGSVLVLFLSSATTATLGASGAIYAVLGALLVTFRKARLDTQFLTQNLLLGVVITVVGWRYISWQGHLGGLLAGAAVAAIVAYAPKSNRSLLQWAGVGALTAVLLGLAVVRAAALA